jgi:hypothetical protein
MTEKYCSMCREKLKDGEIIVSFNGEHYLHTSRTNYSLGSRPMDCATRKVIITGEIISPNKRIYYKGAFQDIQKLDRLQDKINLIIDFNENNNGDVIKGELERLLL